MTKIAPNEPEGAARERIQSPDPAKVLVVVLLCQFWAIVFRTII